MFIWATAELRATESTVGSLEKNIPSGDDAMIPIKIIPRMHTRRPMIPNV